VILSRANPKLVVGLFRTEVPEIDSGSVEVKAIAREAGSRTKIAVASTEESIDPIGSLVGQKGVRVQTVINEISGEKIDIILWSDKPTDFIANSFSPAKVLQVKIVDEERKHALVEVSDDQFSLAIGKKGQNVRLAAKLSGWKIDVRSPKEAVVFDEVAEDDPDASTTETVSDKVEA
jgi:N utilization substance protein A